MGLTLGNLEPLPEKLPEDATIVLCGAAATSLGTRPGEPNDDAPMRERVVDWLKAVFRPGHTLVSICSGALLAGRAGLLDGYECTTHHLCCDELRRIAPRAHVHENRLFVEDRRRYCSAGVTAGTDLMLHMLSSRIGPEKTAAIARYLVVYMRRAGSDPQISPWLTGRNHIHPAVHRVQDAISADPARHWSLNALAELAHTSPRNLSRLFSEHADVSVTEYIAGLRLSLAESLLRETRLDMEAIAMRCGFGSARQLRRAWARLHAKPPRAARSAPASAVQR